MKKILLWTGGILLLAGIIIGASVLYNSLRDEYAPEMEVADGNVQQVYKAPDFEVVDANGEKVKLSSFFGKPIVLNFWASWCPPCKQEMPDFEAAYKKYGDEINFVMVNATGGRETLKTAKAFLTDAGYTFPVFFDTTYMASALYRVDSLPTTFFIDKEGNLVTYANFMLTAEMLEQGINMIR